MAARWEVTANRVLQWDGKPYIPFGWRVPADKLDAAAATGVKDALIDLPLASDWKSVLENAEKHGLRYLIDVSDPAPKAPAFIIDPAAYRIENVAKDSVHTISVPNGISVFYLVLTTPDYAVANKGWAEVVDGKATITLNEPTGTFALLIYPKVKESRLTDYWEGFDVRRDDFLAKLIAAKAGTGLRGVVSPLGKAELWTSPVPRYVPDSTMFRIEFAAYLESKYKNVADLERAWKLLRPNLTDFNSAARLIPLFGSNRGLDSLYDPVNDVMVYATRYQNPYWDDVQAVIGDAAVRRTRRLARSVSDIVDVPVVFEWNGWSPIYDTRQPSGNGLGISAIGLGHQALENNAASGAGSALAWKAQRWLVATDVSAGEMPFPNEQALRDVVSDLVGLGTKGWFVRWSGGSEAPWVKAMAAEAATSDIVSRSPKAIFYPENARFPANTMELPGGVWWLPTPVSGNRLDLGPEYEAYRIKSEFADYIALWRLGEPKKVKLRFTDAAGATITTYDGRPVESKVIRGGLELTLDNMPVIIEGTDEIPIPEDSVDLLRADHKSLADEARRRGMQIGNQLFIFEDAYRSFDRNPGASFAKMTTALKELEVKVAPYIWIEGESAPEANFSEMAKDPAASSERALVLDTPLKPESGSYFATYKFTVDLDQAVMDVWLAADVPEKLRSQIKIDVGGTNLAMPGTPQSGYGDGFGWYNLGKLNLSSGKYVLTIKIPASAPLYRMRIDALLLTPLPFTPAGPRMPRYVPGF